MRINFKRIEIKNFMSFEEEAFDFLSRTGMTLVHGVNNDFPGQKNGTGKTNLWAALLYSLFGQSFFSKMKNENIVNRQSSSKEMRLVLWLDIDGTSYKITRGISKKAAFLNVYRVLDENKDEDLTKSSIADTQEMIETDILKCDVSIFLRTVLLTADQTYNFYLLKKADKKDFVEKLFDISVFEDMWKLVHRDVLDLKKDIASKQSFIFGLSKNIDDCESRVKKHEVEHSSRLKILEESISKDTCDLKKLEDSKVACDVKTVEKLEKAIEKLEEMHLDLNSKELELSKKISRCELGIEKLESTKSTNSNAIAKHNQVLEKLCDDCKKIFKEYCNLDVCEKAIKDADVGIDKLEKTRKSLELKKQELKTENSETASKLQKARAKMKELTAASSEHRAAVARLESKIESLKNELAKTKSEKNPWNEMLVDTQSKMDAENSNLESLVKKSKKLELAESIVSQDTLRKFVIKDLVVLLNNKIKTYLTKLGAGFYVVFDEDMDYEFVTPSGSCEWSNFSAGERMKTMIATSFAFRDFMIARNGLSANLLVLDEYFDSAIDDLTVERILDMLKTMSVEMNQSIYVITHRKEVTPDMFDNLLVVEKTKGTSHIKFV